MDNRSEEEVIKSVLHTAMGKGAGLSQIMFSTYLTYTMAVQYISKLIEKEMIANVPAFGSRYYRTTVKGIEYLSLLERNQ